MKSIPLERNTSEEVAVTLSRVLADTYVLYLKTQNFHWNITDPRFYSLHLLFEKQYGELAESIDVIAERIRMLGVRAPGSMRQFLELTELRESEDRLTGDEMITELMEDHVELADALRGLIEETSQLSDEGTVDLFIELLRAHEKNAWMLRSHLANANFG